jgi:hypothetical protein
MSNITQIILASAFIAIYIILTLFSIQSTVSEYRSKCTDKRTFLFNLIWSVILTLTSLWLISLIVYLRSI